MMIPDSKHDRLVNLPRSIEEKTGNPSPFGYKRLYLAAIDGRLPATKRIGKGWYFDPSRVGEIAAALGLCVQNEA